MATTFNTAMRIRFEENFTVEEDEDPNDAVDSFDWREALAGHLSVQGIAPEEAQRVVAEAKLLSARNTGSGCFLATQEYDVWGEYTVALDASPEVLDAVLRCVEDEALEILRVRSRTRVL